MMSTRFWIMFFFYEKKWNDFNQKKNSSSLFNQNEDITKLLKDCVEMKKIVVKMYDDFFLYCGIVI